jgi:hypothetical protein
MGSALASLRDIGSDFFRKIYLWIDIHSPFYKPDKKIGFADNQKLLSPIFSG